MHNTEPQISQDAAGQGQRSSQTRPSLRQRQPRWASVAMAVLTSVALLYYLGNLFVACPRPTAAGPGDND